MMHRIDNIKLFSVPSDYGRGANEGAYYPLSLLRLAMAIRKSVSNIGISVVDMFHDPAYRPRADVVGISASSTLNYQGVLDLAEKAKAQGSIVVIGGAHASHLADQILRNRSSSIDYVIRGHGEDGIVSLISALRRGSSLTGVPGLSWRGPMATIRHNPVRLRPWDYEEHLPLDLSLLNCGIQRYWRSFQRRIDRTVQAAFLVFTHFGCGYRESRSARPPVRGSLTHWCSYCSLDGPALTRSGESIVRETLDLIHQHKLPKQSKILLKCYGDNVGTQVAMLKDLSRTIDQTPEWHAYDIRWTFYCQSCRVTSSLMELLSKVRTSNLYIGFDSADDVIQRLNGLGTSIKTHRLAIVLARKYGIKIQAGFVLGCAGETRKSLEATVSFAQELATAGVLERTNAAILFVIPGAPTYDLLCDREPWIRDLDLLPTRELQLLWIEHFCPGLGRTPEEALALLEDGANRIDELSPGPHASMGFVSRSLAADLKATRR